MKLSQAAIQTLEKLLGADEIVEVKCEGAQKKVTIVRISRKVIFRDTEKEA